MDNNSVRQSERPLPVFLGNDREHVMANAEIFRTPDKILIQIASTGPESQYLGDFLTRTEVLGLYLSPVPLVPNIREKRKTT